MKSLVENIEESIKSSELTNIGLDISEIAIDQFLKEGLFKDLPLVNSIVAIFKTAFNIKDALFIKKLLLFLESVQKAPSEKRTEFLNEISLIVHEKKRLFEKILLTLDKIDDSGKVPLIGKVFKHLIVGNISLFQYYKIVRVIEDMFLDEINYFFYEYGHFKHTDETRNKLYYYMELIGSNNLKDVMLHNGLFEIKEELKFKENVKPQSYRIEKKESLTELGHLFAEFGFETHLRLTNPIE